VAGKKLDRNKEWDARRVRALRQHLKLTQAGMADRLGMRQQTVSEWEVGIYAPRGASIKMLSIVADHSKFQYDAGK
jgi:DNA-binding transcriptional regulator YiaG